MNLTGLIMFTTGAVLLYSAVKDKDPRDVILVGFGQKARFGKNGGITQNISGGPSTIATDVNREREQNAGNTASQGFLATGN